MVQTLTLPAFGPRRVIVLAINRPAETLRAARDPAARAGLVAALLGRTDAKQTHVDLIAVAELHEIGLAGFLLDGPGIPAAELAPHRARLEALTGHVLILYPGVFEADTEIALGPDLTLIAELAPEPTSWHPAQTLTSAAATEMIPGRKQPSDAAMSGRIAMLALLVLALLTVAMVWIA